MVTRERHGCGRSGASFPYDGRPARREPRATDTYDGRLARREQTATDTYDGRPARREPRATDTYDGRPARREQTATGGDAHRTKRGTRATDGDVHRTACRAPSGFTLVELLVVIAIIGVLVGLLVVALGVARASVQESAMVVEVNSMSQALKAFTTNHETDYPPDFSVRFTNTGPNTGRTPQRQAIDQFLSRMFRYRNPQTDVPRQMGGGPQPQLLEMLDPAEALYFWLRGFTNDPQNPLFGPLGVNPDLIERSPVFEFDKSRLLDKDNDGWLEYYPRFARERPYLYFVHYNYIRNFAKLPKDLAYNFGTVNGTEQLAPRPYLSTLAAAEPSPKIQAHYAAADTFQIISAGMDNDFGLQIANASLADYLPYAYPTGPYPDKAHKDNITSFAEKTLEDALP